MTLLYLRVRKTIFKGRTTIDDAMTDRWQKPTRIMSSWSGRWYRRMHVSPVSREFAEHLDINHGTAHYNYHHWHPGTPEAYCQVCASPSDRRTETDACDLLCITHEPIPETKTQKRFWTESSLWTRLGHNVTSPNWGGSLRNGAAQMIRDQARRDKPVKAEADGLPRLQQ